MNKTAKLLFALLLIFILAFALAACSTPPDSSGNGETGGEGGNGTGGETGGEGEGGTINVCIHSYTEIARVEPMSLRDGSVTYKCSDCGNTYDEVVPATKIVKILAIGHSYSIDTTTYLWDICKSAGAETIIIGNLYIAGCPLGGHWTNIQNNAKAYRYYKNTSGTWTTREETSIEEALLEEDWDIITLQQGPSASGLPAHYSMLSDVVNYINENKTNPDAEIWWHLTWASEQDYMEETDTVYGKSQMTMYNAILNAYKEAVVDVIPNKIIPSGTTVQNLRTTYLGDTLTRDGYHMSHDHGRYATALTWYVTLTGGSLEDVTWMPDKNRYPYIKDDLGIIHEAINNAIENPLEITPSKYPTLPTDADIFAENGIDINDYELLEFTITPGGYYNSWIGDELITDDAEKSPYYAATNRISFEDLPAGSVIIVDRGYEIAVQSWQSESVPISTTPTITISSGFTQIHKLWWGVFKLRAFNISHAGASIEMTEDDSACIRIYVPKT